MAFLEISFPLYTSQYGEEEKSYVVLTALNKVDGEPVECYIHQEFQYKEH